MAARGETADRDGVAATESRNWRLLELFLPDRARLRLASVGAGSFVGGLAESGVLVLMTLVAEGLIRGADSIDLQGRSIPSRTAVLVALVLIVLRVVLTLTTARTAARFSAEVMGRAQRGVLDAYLTTSHAVRSLRPPGDLQAVMVSNARFTGDLASAFAQVAASVCGLLAFGITSLVINPVAMVGIAAVGALLVLVLRPMRNHSRTAARSFERTTRALGHEIAQVEGLHREIRVFRVEEQVEARLDVDIAAGGERYRSVRFLGQAVPQVFQSLLMGAAVLALLFLVETVDSGSNLATAGAVVLLLVRSMSTAQQLVTANQRVIELGSYARGLNELIAQFHRDRITAGRERPDSVVPVELDRVSFSYDGHHEVFSELSLRFAAGEVIGVVGRSGAGKSTLVELLLHLREPTGGSVRFGGIEASRVDPTRFAERIAIVPQNPVLIDGTVAENVAFFRDLPEERIVEALDLADLLREVEQLPEGIHTRLGSDERALSGGQRQRLTIARALAGQPQVLVLDEPTSALDTRSEAVVAETIGRGAAQRVTVVVAHRISTLRACTRILVVDGGRITFDGGPEQVAERSEFFAAMLDADRS